MVLHEILFHFILEFGKYLMLTKCVCASESESVHSFINKTKQIIEKIWKPKRLKQINSWNNNRKKEKERNIEELIWCGSSVVFYFFEMIK